MQQSFIISCGKHSLDRPSAAFPLAHFKVDSFFGERRARKTSFGEFPLGLNTN